MAGSLQEAEEQRRNLVADVAHELRTPLFNIQGYLEAVKDGLLEPDEGTIDTIHGQVLHLGRLVEDLRLLAQAESGGLHLELETDSLDELVSRSVDAARPRAEASGVDLVYRPPGQLTLVDMDRTRIAQVVSNILDNAVQHTPAGGQVRVAVDTAGDARARVTVDDDGEGIPSEDLPLVFERFYRVDASRSRSTGGAGLGLTIAKRLVESHGGVIWAESGSSRGTRVNFELPASGQSLSG
jgi:signal transduction histidine kinase